MLDCQEANAVTAVASYSCHISIVLFCVSVIVKTLDYSYMYLTWSFVHSQQYSAHDDVKRSGLVRFIELFRGPSPSHILDEFRDVSQ